MVQRFALRSGAIALILTLLFCSTYGCCGAHQEARASGARHKAPLTFIQNVRIPGAPASGWCRDVAAVSGGHYYLADDSNKRLSVLAIHHDGHKDQYAPSAAITSDLFHGVGRCAKFDFSLEAPEGALAYRGQLWVGNVFVDHNNAGHSQVLVFDQASGKLLHTIPTGGQKRADEMTVMPTLGLIAVTNPDETFANPPQVPWLSFISTTTYQVVARLPFSSRRCVQLCPPRASPGQSGLQQPEWIGGNQLLVDVPVPVGNASGGELDRVTVTPHAGTYSFAVERFPLALCQPAGLSLDVQTGLAAVGCGYVAAQGGTPGNQLIWNFRTNTVVATISGIQGVDIVATTSHGLFLFPSYVANTLYVTDKAGHILQQIPTSDGAHTVNFDAATGQVFVPTGGGVVAVYGTR